MQVSATRVRVTRKIGFLNRAITFRLDDEVTSQDASARLLVKGWVVHRSRFIAEVSLRANSETLASGALDVHRPGVQQRYPTSPNGALAGFEFKITTPSSNRLGLFARLENGRQVLLANLDLELRSEPRLLFMHIPKAAGSYVNRYFAKHFASNHFAVHLESNADWERDPDRIRRLDFISGHVTLPRLASKLNIEDYIKVTVLRDPFAQVVSHLAWIRRLADAEESSRLKMHPPYIQSFAHKLAAANLDSPAEIRQVLADLEESENRLVENCQTRYFTAVEPGRNVTNEDLEKAIEASESFEIIGLTGGIDRFLRSVADRMGWPPPAPQSPENVSRGYYGLDPKNPDHRKALQPLVCRDVVLLEAIKKVRNLAV